MIDSYENIGWDVFDGGRVMGLLESLGWSVYKKVVFGVDVEGFGVWVGS